MLWDGGKETEQMEVGVFTGQADHEEQLSDMKECPFRCRHQLHLRSCKK